MATVALTLGLLLALLVAFLAIPLTVVFSVRRIGAVKGIVRFRWLFGLVRFQLRFPRASGDGSRPAPAPARKKAPSAKKGRKGRAGAFLSLVRDRAIRRRVRRFVGDLLRAADARDLLLRLRIGLGDPADTGILWALVGPVAGLARNLRGANVEIDPAFTEAVFAVECHGQVRFVPIRIVGLAAVFALSPTMLRAWWRLGGGRS